MPVLRDVFESDLDAFFEHQREPEANEMAVFPARDRETFYAHWRRILADDSLIQRTIVDGDEVAGPRVQIKYSLTSMGCPAGPLIQQSIEEVAASLPGVEEVETELTWDPPWTPDKMSEDAKFILGFG